MPAIFLGRGLNRLGKRRGAFEHEGDEVRDEGEPRFERLPVRLRPARKELELKVRVNKPREYAEADAGQQVVEKGIAEARRRERDKRTFDPPQGVEVGRPPFLFRLDEVEVALHEVEDATLRPNGPAADFFDERFEEAVRRRGDPEPFPTAEVVRVESFVPPGFGIGDGEGVRDRGHGRPDEERTEH